MLSNVRDCSKQPCGECQERLRVAMQRLRGDPPEHSVSTTAGHSLHRFLDLKTQAEEQASRAIARFHSAVESCARVAEGYPNGCVHRCSEFPAALCAACKAALDIATAIRHHGAVMGALP